MADAVTSQTLNDGAEHCVIVLTNLSDGTGEAAVLKVDVSALNGTPTAVNLRKVRYSVWGMSVSLLWDATTDVRALVLQGDGALDFDSVGGIPNNSGTGKTGDLLLTTTGHTAGDTYTIVLELEKVY